MQDECPQEKGKDAFSDMVQKVVRPNKCRKSIWPSSVLFDCWIWRSICSLTLMGKKKWLRIWKSAVSQLIGISVRSNGVGWGGIGDQKLIAVGCLLSTVIRNAKGNEIECLTNNLSVTTIAFLWEEKKVFDLLEFDLHINNCFSPQSWGMRTAGRCVYCPRKTSSSLQRAWMCVWWVKLTPGLILLLLNWIQLCLEIKVDFVSFGSFLLPASVLQIVVSNLLQSALSLSQITGENGGHQMWTVKLFPVLQE